jgi:hypothetical protein
MAAAPPWKIYEPGPDGALQYVGAVKRPEYGAMLVACLDEGAEVRFGHSSRAVVWTEGAEEFSAADSYDGAAEIMVTRFDHLGGRA